MYVNPLTMYREYIQNTADAYDVMREVESRDDSGRVQICIDRQARTIKVTDYGHGLNEQEFYHRLTSIGGSKKRGTKARGFRGVGRLAGLAYCQELVFRTRPRGDSRVYELRWDARKIRGLLRSPEAELDLAGIVSQSVEFRTIPAFETHLHFFEVELRGVIRHGNDSLLDAGEVAKYLGQVAPVPFRPDFEFGHQIVEFLNANGAIGRPLSIDIEGEGRVFRPHADQLTLSNGKAIKFTQLETFRSLDRDGNLSAASWVLHHEYNGALPKSSNINGWRLRFGDIQVGENDLVEDLFSESRFNSWAVAETHVLDRKITPNGRRDDFEQSAFYSDLLTRLTPHVRNIAQLCRASSANRNFHLRIEKEILKCEEKIQTASKKRTPSAVIKTLTDEVERCLDSLEAPMKRGSMKADEGNALDSRIKRLRSKIRSLNKRKAVHQPLAEFPTTERRLLNQVFEAIYASSIALSLADDLIAKIVSKLRKGKLSSRSATRKTTMTKR